MASEGRSASDPSANPSKRFSPEIQADADLTSHSLPAVAFSASVLFGLALLPFIMPLVWIAAKILMGWEPNVSLAIPIALALTAATLSLAVVSTVDWTPATRVKGVLMIVGLAYFTGGTLFFLKREAIEWFKQQIHDDLNWQEFKPPRGDCKVQVPVQMAATKDQLMEGWDGKVFRAARIDLEEMRTFTFAVDLENPWNKKLRKRVISLDEAQRQLIAESGKPSEDFHEPPYRPRPNQKGREWSVSFDQGVRRVVRIYHIEDRLYYLAVEGVNVSSENEDVIAFFNSFILLQDEDL